MIKDDWHESQGNIGPVYWREDPANKQMRWHVSRNEAHTFGSVAGQILEEAGWYWYTANILGWKFSSMFGPFTSADAAMADCTTANKPMVQP